MTVSTATRASTTVRSYLALTKPRIIELLLVTAVPAMVLAAAGPPPVTTLIATLVGGALAAGSSNALNCYLDRDIDAVMHRTRGRPLPSGEISPRAALGFGLALGAVATAILALATTLLAAALAVATIAFYVLVYTAWLKRRSPQNIVWGGAAGGMPVLIGWAAVTGSLGLLPVVMFLIVFFWTPPHFWALALRFRADYAAAGVPMLPAVAPPERVGRQIVGYTWVTVALTGVLLVLTGSWAYDAVAVVLSAVFLVEAHGLAGRLRRGQPAAPMRLFRWSIRYLTLLYGLLAIDALISAWT